MNLLCCLDLMVGDLWCQPRRKRGLKLCFSPRSSLRIFPDLARCLDDKLKLPPLFVFCQEVAIHR